MIKRHNSFISEGENLALAKGLESLLVATADVFSFFNKCETYDTVLQVLRELQLIEYLYYEVVFFVPGKTQNEHRQKARRSETRKAAYQLLFKILKFLRPHDMVVFLQDLFLSMIETVPTPN